MNISINVKSGTGGYYDYGNCDLKLKDVDETFPIPRIGESIDILEDNDKKKTNAKGEVLQEYHQYLVTDVRYWLAHNNHGITIYVVPVGRTIQSN